MLLARTRKVYQAISTRIKPDLLLKRLLSLRNKKRFSTYLVTTVVMLATLSVFVILIALYGYFGKRVESEFRKKILAEKGQVEIILNNRISSIAGMLKDLGSDNIIRVTVMLDGKSQLQERVSEFYPSREGVYFFVKKQGEDSVVPETYPQLSTKLIDLVRKSYPYGEVLEDEGKKHLVW